ncbi:MAG: flavin reductase family protein [Elainellaceae cyanobacterium]
MEIDPELLEPSLRYKLLIGSVVPRPIAFVSSLSPQGVANLAPFSYFNAVGHIPLALMFSVSLKPDGSEKDTLRNVRPPSEGGTGEYVINLAIESYAHQVAECAEPLPYGESEFDYVNLSPTPSKVVKPPRVAESPVAFECRTLQIVPVGQFHVVIGQVVHLFVRDEVLGDRNRIDSDKLGAIGRMAGYEYCRTGDRFEIPNGFPKPAEGQNQTPAQG